MPSLHTLPGIEFVPLNNRQRRLQERNWLCSKSTIKLASDDYLAHGIVKCTADTTIVLFDNL